MLRRNRAHCLLDCAGITEAEALLSTCEGWMACGWGLNKMWDGHKVLWIMAQIEKRGGGLRGIRTSQAELLAIKERALEAPEDHCYTSEFLRELLVAAMGMSDLGYLHTRDEPGKENAMHERGFPQFQRLRMGQHFWCWGREFIKLSMRELVQAEGKMNARPVLPRDGKGDDLVFFGKKDYVELSNANQRNKKT